MLHPGKRIIDRPISWVVLAYVAIVLLVILTAADNYLNHIATSALGARLAIYSGFLGLFSIFFGVVLWDAMRTGGVRILHLYRSVGYILVPLGLVAIVGLAFLLHPTAYWGERGGSKLFPLWPLIDFLIVVFGVSLAAIPSVVRHHRSIFVLSLTVLAFTVLWDVFSLGKFSFTEGRAAGFVVEPNEAAHLLVALSIAGVDWKRSSFLNGIIWLVAGMGVFATLSRGGFVLYICALGAYIVLTVRPRVRVLLKYTVITIVFASIIAFGWVSIASFLESTEMFSAYNAQRRLAQLETLIRGDPTSVSTDERAHLFYRYIDIVTQSPVLGYGTGFTYSEPLGPHRGPHNIYLNQWTNNGVLGLVVLLTFLFASFLHFKRYKDVRGMVFVAVFCVAGFFSHTLLDERYFLVMFGFLGALAYVERFRSVGSPPSLLRA